jgi:hypothetical protein
MFVRADGLRPDGWVSRLDFIASCSVHIKCAAWRFFSTHTFNKQ